MDDLIQKQLMLKQQKLISELVERNLVLETYVEVLQQQLKTIAEQDLETKATASDGEVDSSKP